MGALKLKIIPMDVGPVTVMLEPYCPSVDLAEDEYAEIELDEQVDGNELEIVVKPGLIKVWNLDWDKETIVVKKSSK